LDVGLEHSPRDAGPGDLGTQGPEKEHSLFSEREPGKEDNHEGQETELDPAQERIEGNFEITHLLAETDKLVDLVGDILDLMDKLDGDGVNVSRRISSDQLDTFDAVGVVNLLDLAILALEFASSADAIVEVEHPAIGVLESTFLQVLVADTASVHGVLILLVVQHRGGGISALGLISLSMLLVATSGGQVPQVTFGLSLAVEIARGVRLLGVEVGQGLVDQIIGVGALARLVASTGDVSGVQLSVLVLAKGILRARLATMLQTTTVNLLDENTPFNGRGGLAASGGASEPVSNFEFTVVTDQLGSKFGGVLDINIRVAVRRIGVVADDNVITFLDVATALLQPGDALVFVLETEEDLRVGVVANTRSVDVLVVTWDTLTLVVSFAQVITDGKLRTDVSPLTGRALGLVVVSLLGEMEQSVHGSVALVARILPDTLDVEQTGWSVRFLEKLVDDLGSRALDGRDRSRVLGNDTRPLEED
jgi:hypothetical protein